MRGFEQEFLLHVCPLTCVFIKLNSFLSWGILATFFLLAFIYGHLLVVFSSLALLPSRDKIYGCLDTLLMVISECYTGFTDNFAWRTSRTVRSKEGKKKEMESFIFRLSSYLLFTMISFPTCFLIFMSYAILWFFSFLFAKHNARFSRCFGKNKEMTLVSSMFSWLT